MLNSPLRRRVASADNPSNVEQKDSPEKPERATAPPARWICGGASSPKLGWGPGRGVWRLPERIPVGAKSFACSSEDKVLWSMAAEVYQVFCWPGWADGQNCRGAWFPERPGYHQSRRRCGSMHARAESPGERPDSGCQRPQERRRRAGATASIFLISEPQWRGRQSQKLLLVAYFLTGQKVFESDTHA